jgi:hypothetical protein
MNFPRTFPLAAAMLALMSGCVSRSEYSALQARLRDTQAQLADAQKQAFAAKTQVAVLMRQVALQDAELSSGLVQHTGIDKPMPAKISFRPAPSGTAYIAVVTTTLSERFLARVVIVSPGTARPRRFRLVVPALGSQEIGSGRPADIQEGDIIRLSCPGYKPLSVTFHAGAGK